MALTVEDVARAACAALDSDAGHLLASNWVVERYRELATRVRFRHLRQVGELTIPAPITAGTVTYNLGETTVTGDTTARAAWANNNVIGRFILLGDEWYAVVGDTLAGDLMLQTPITNPSVTGGSYRLYQRHIALPVAARQLGTFVALRQARPLDVLSLVELNLLAPRRGALSGGPSSVTEIGIHPDGSRLVEFYPYSTQPEHIAFTYYAQTADEMHPTDVLPPQVDVATLKCGVMADLLRYEMMKLIRKGDFNGAGLLRNEMRTQLTEWNAQIAQASRADVGLDDVTMLLATAGHGAASDGDVQTAFDFVWRN